MIDTETIMNQISQIILYNYITSTHGILSLNTSEISQLIQNKPQINLFGSEEFKKVQL